MRRRALCKRCATVERLEVKTLLSGGLVVAHHGAGAAAEIRRLTAHPAVSTLHLPTRFLAFRVTNPSAANPYTLVPPFQQVLVQSKQPVPGQVYNVLQIALKNGTAQTFSANSGFFVKVTGDRRSFPILTGSERWKPKQVIVLYILTKKYYPLPEVSGGFIVDLGGATSTLIPGPSGIFLRVKYNPATFAKTLDWIVAYGPGNQGGKGASYGLPNTSIFEFVAASAKRNDFGGHF
jgi:hypothetical protein